MRFSGGGGTPGAYRAWNVERFCQRSAALALAGTLGVGGIAVASFQRA
jgi:hypothetical protein